VQRMPGFQQRDARSEVARVVLRQRVRELLDLWHGLRLHIRDVKGWRLTQKPMLEAAGHGHYGPAQRGKKADMLGLAQRTVAFLDKHEAELTADGNMRPEYGERVRAAAAAVEAQLLETVGARQTNSVLADQLLEAENALVERVMRVFDDGKFVFAGQPAVAKRFTWSRVLGRVKKGKVGVGIDD
jgi:hypothetical protein